MTKFLIRETITVIGEGQCNAATHTHNKHFTLTHPAPDPTQLHS